MLLVFFSLVTFGSVTGESSYFSLTCKLNYSALESLQGRIWERENVSGLDSLSPDHYFNKVEEFISCEKATMRDFSTPEIKRWPHFGNGMETLVARMAVVC